VQQFFKLVVQGTDTADAQVSWYVKKKWVEINTVDKLGCNAAHYAVAKNRKALVAWLAGHGINLMHQNLVSHLLTAALDSLRCHPAGHSACTPPLTMHVPAQALAWRCRVPLSWTNFEVDSQPPCLTAC
jgi:hypothetical protein